MSSSEPPRDPPGHQAPVKKTLGPAYLRQLKAKQDEITAGKGSRKSGSSVSSAGIPPPPISEDGQRSEGRVLDAKYLQRLKKKQETIMGSSRGSGQASSTASVHDCENCDSKQRGRVFEELGPDEEYYAQAPSTIPFGFNPSDGVPRHHAGSSAKKRTNETTPHMPAVDAESYKVPGAFEEALVQYAVQSPPSVPSPPPEMVQQATLQTFLRTSIQPPANGPPIVADHRQIHIHNNHHDNRQYYGPGPTPDAETPDRASQPSIPTPPSPAPPANPLLTWRTLGTIAALAGALLGAVADPRFVAGWQGHRAKVYVSGQVAAAWGCVVRPVACLGGGGERTTTMTMTTTTVYVAETELAGAGATPVVRMPVRPLVDLRGALMDGSVVVEAEVERSDPRRMAEGWLGGDGIEGAGADEAVEDEAIPDHHVGELVKLWDTLVLQKQQDGDSTSPHRSTSEIAKEACKFSDKFGLGFEDQVSHETNEVRAILRDMALFPAEGPMLKVWTGKSQSGKYHLDPATHTPLPATTWYTYRASVGAATRAVSASQEAVLAHLARIEGVVDRAVAFRVAQEERVRRWLDEAGGGVGPVNARSCRLALGLRDYKRVAGGKVRERRRAAVAEEKREDGGGGSDVVLAATDSHMALVRYAAEVSWAYCLMSGESLEATKRAHKALVADVRRCEKLAQEVRDLKTTIKARLGMVRSPGDFVAVMESDKEIRDFAEGLLAWLEEEAEMTEKD
ncbi:hypothetical protein QBC33DRAFT_564343 [Phialemonium atrogriseum]|uniref:Uncharacterized protein n=1 Tax=Phialemonium atrogriseum TaxID=1093897 RepID=A0AAJ0FAY4_9PEZI|nr:uncharacterized protein QBC33DRAFT_564343 [Phialemonium atrogriseum]KAK1761891.1 hypothetical protein QBC33DRAFT_564343 [Phialemonium atrogriseum]